MLSALLACENWGDDPEKGELVDEDAKEKLEGIDEERNDEGTWNEGEGDPETKEEPPGPKANTPEPKVGLAPGVEVALSGEPKDKGRDNAPKPGDGVEGPKAFGRDNKELPVDALPPIEPKIDWEGPEPEGIPETEELEPKIEVPEAGLTNEPEEWAPNDPVEVMEEKLIAEFPKELRGVGDEKSDELEETEVPNDPTEVVEVKVADVLPKELEDPKAGAVEEANP